MKTSSSYRPKIAHVTTIDLSLSALLLPQLKALADAGYEVVGISAPGPYVSELVAAGIRHIPWAHASRSWQPVSDVRAGLELARIFKRERFDLVHTHNPKPGVLGRIAARATGVPAVVNTVHGFYMTPSDPHLKKRTVLTAERIAAWFADIELYQSREDLDLALKVGLASPSKLRYLGNGVDVRFFEASKVAPKRRAEVRSALGLPREAIVVGAVGRLVAEKGYRELFEAFERIASQHPSVGFIVIGERDPEKADSLSLEEIDRYRRLITFAGWRDDVRDLLGAVDIFVLASWREGVPRALIEAAAMERAIVATDIRGCREVVRHESEGLLVPVRSERALAAAITRLIDDEVLRSDLGRAARERAAAQFDEGRVIGTILETYGEILRSKGLMPISDEEPKVRHAKRSDAPAVAAVHAATLPDAFLPKLGTRFLTLLYLALIRSADAVVVVAEREGRVVGFCSGVRSVKGFYRSFARRYGVFALIALLPKLVHPSLIKGVFETARYPRLDSASDSELLAIGVIPEAARSGIGRRLVGGFLSAMSSMDVGSIQVVVASDNEAASGFYADCGFSRSGSVEVHGQNRSNVWTIECHSLSGS